MAMMGFYGDTMASGYWPVGVLMMVIFWIGVVLLGVFAYRALRRSEGSAPGQALAILKGRLATGQITADEYEKTRRALLG